MNAFEDFRWTGVDELRRLALDDDLWRAYAETAVEFVLPDGGHLVVTPADDGDGDRPPLGPLHVITAVQPDGDPDSPDSAARGGVLAAELDGLGLRRLHAVGRSADGRHRESGFAVFGLDDDRARALGVRYGQVAVFAWHDAVWSLLASAADRRTDRRFGWARAGSADT